MRRLLAITVAAGALASACCGPQRAAPAQGSHDAPGASHRVPGEYLVTLAAGADAKAVEDVFGGLGVKRIQDLGGNLVLVSLRDDPGPERMAELARKDARIQAVQPNFVYQAQ